MSAATTTTKALDQLDRLSVDTIRFLSVDAVEKADSGHPGLPMDAAPMAYVLWTRFLKYNPANPGWEDRDRFVLSAGHGSMLLYSLLYLTGYDLPLEQIKQFREWSSITPGHPERGLTPGVEVTTGPLGQGFANGVGMAIAEDYLAARYNQPGHEIVNHYTYALVSDGDLMEGVSSEAASLAGHLKLGKLIYLYDDNRVTLSAATDITFTVVSMPSWEMFDAQPRSYRESVLPPLVRARLSVEAGASQGWCKYAGDDGDVIGVDRFGASAPGKVVMREYGFTVDHICERAMELVNRKWAAY